MIGRRKRAEAAMLATLGPQEAAEMVAAWGAIDSASVYVRGEDDDGLRVIVHAPGIGCWRHDHETTANRFAKRFSSLQEPALAAIVRAIDGRALLTAEGGVMAPARKRWVTGWMD